MEVFDTLIPDVKLLRPKRHIDHRGYFSETYSRAALADAGIDVEFVQDNQSLSVRPHVVRGLHFQIAPFDQGKLLRVLHGAIFDVAVDLRHGSPTYGRHVSVILRAEDWNQIFIPVGFAHGFCTIRPDTEVLYKVSSYYSPQHERGLLWNDPDLAIDWPIDPAVVTLSERDSAHPRLCELPPYFGFGGGLPLGGVVPPASQVPAVERRGLR
jgi:dTDP-4-dehydrorhamnose 3,5-epimerase